MAACKKSKACPGNFKCLVDGRKTGVAHMELLRRHALWPGAHPAIFNGARLWPLCFASKAACFSEKQIQRVKGAAEKSRENDAGFDEYSEI